MKAWYRFLAQSSIAAALVGAVFAACAEGTDFEETAPVPQNDGGTTSTGIPKGEIGGPCDVQADCKDSDATCTQVGVNKVCTKPCPPTCPQGTYCSIIQGDPICVPNLGQMCLPCTGSVDCKNPSDECLTSPFGDKFCAIDCTTIPLCPNGFTCMAASDYLSSGGMGSSSGGNGGNGGGGGAGGGSDAGSPPPPVGVPYKFCVPSGGLSCPCNDKRDGVKRSCKVENADGVCTGSESCDGAASKWVGCTAKTPTAEVCNAVDDNCNTVADESDPNSMCMAEGPPPPHAGWQCKAGICSVAPCEAGWVAYPQTGVPEDGCPCQVEMGEPNDSCGAATNAGQVSDSGGSLSISGTLSSDSDVDMWVFNTVDDAQAGTNAYHVSIDFTAPMPNDEFVMAVMRGDPCMDAPGGAASEITSYDWCVDGSFNGSNGMMGEGPCGPQSAVHCANHSSVYYVRVSRKAGAVGSCTGYSITVTAQGGDACDFSKACP